MASVYSATSPDYPPQYHDPRFVIEYPAGVMYYSYSGYWPEVIDRRKFFYSSASNSELVFDETATKKDEQHYGMYSFVDATWIFPEEGIDTEYCFGKHAWYVEISLIQFWPWFDATTAINESVGGDAFYLQQWGPFENGVQMPYEPIYNSTDEHYPIFGGGALGADSKQFHSVFTGWA